MTAKNGRVQFGQTTIRYSVNRRRGRRTLAITVSPDAGVNVTAPEDATAAEIQSAVKARAIWVLNQQLSLSRYARPRPRQFISGESYPYLGRQFQLKVRRVLGPDKKGSVILRRGRFQVQVSREGSEARQRARVRSLLVEWYRSHAGPSVERVVGYYAAALGVRHTGVSIRELRKRWGSCTQDGRIFVNWRSVMASRRLLAYIVAHELCHLRHPDHSMRFWRLLQRVMPDYAIRRDELARSGPTYDL